MSVNVIVATDLKFGIGNEGNLPWPKNERDMTWFREHTIGHVVVMGRKTWESIGSKPLPKRTNIVITSQALDGPDMTLSGDMGQILNYVKDLFDGLHVWVIGGSEIYSQAIPYCEKLYLTTINGMFKCDAYVVSDIITKFPVIEHWQEDPEITFQIRGR